MVALDAAVSRLDESEGERAPIWGPRSAGVAGMEEMKIWSLMTAQELSIFLGLFGEEGMPPIEYRREKIVAARQVMHVKRRGRGGEVPARYPCP